MWTRAELKFRAKENLRKYFWAALAVSLVCSLFNSEGGSNAGAGANAGMNVTQEYNVNIPEDFSGDLGSVVDQIPYAAEGIVESMDAVTAGMLLIGVLVGLTVGLALSIFVAPLVEVGKNRFYMESRAAGYSAGMDCLIWGFKNHYLNIVWTMFLRNLIVILGTFCCIIPGIYFAYCYYMVPYILAENPEMKASDALRMSKDMMEGHKLNTWVLELSFLGWWIVGAMACGIGTFLVYPYYDATFAELYAVLRGRFSNYLNGFGVETMGAGYGNGYYDGNYGGYYHGPNGSQNNNWQQPYEQPYQQPYEQPYQQSYEQPYQQPYEQPYQQSYEQPYQQPYELPYQQPYQEMNEQSYGNGSEQSGNAEQPPAERGGEVKRSEGGPGRGYYLNGVFHPYTEDELNELEQNRK